MGHARPTGYHGGWAWAGMAALGGWVLPAMGWVGVAGQPSSFFVFLLFFLSFFLWPTESSVFFFFFPI
jgi:hypothetical protein